MAYRLKRGEAVGDGARRVAKEELGAAVRNLALPAEQRDTGIHEARKSLKKVRALLRLLGPAMGEEASREARRLRNAARRISGFRDAAVAIETLDGLLADRATKESDKAAPDAGIYAFRASLVQMKAASEEGGVGKALQLASAVMARAEGRVKSWRIPAEGDAAIRPGLEKTYRRGRKALSRARGRFQGDLGHALRKRVKDLWYDVRLLEGPWLRAAKLSKRLSELETLLGNVHNLAMLGERLPAGTGHRRKDEWQHRLEEWIAASQAVLCRKAEALSAKVYAEKPGAFVRGVLIEKAANKGKPGKAAA